MRHAVSLYIRRRDRNVVTVTVTAVRIADMRTVARAARMSRWPSMSGMRAPKQNLGE